METTNSTSCNEIKMDVQYLDYYLEAIQKLFQDDRFVKCFELVSLVGKNNVIIDAYTKIKFQKLPSFFYNIYDR